MSQQESVLSPDIFNVSNINELNESLRNGSNINEKNFFEETPLLWAVRGEKDVALIEEFLKRGADVNAQDCWGITPLYTAVTKSPKNLKLIKLLLESGENIKGGRCVNDRALEKVFIRHRPCAALLIKYKFLKNHSLIKQPVLSNNFQTSKNYYLEYKEVIDLNINQSCFNAFASYLDECAVDVLHMKSVQLCNVQSLLDFVTSKISLECIQAEVAKQVTYQVLKELNSFHYMVYKSMIASRIGREYLLRTINEQLLQINVKPLNGCKGHTFLNSDLMYLIAQYLSDEDLLNFATAYFNHLVTVN